MTQLDLDARPLEAATVIHISGELDMATANELAEALRHAIEGKPPRVVVDLSELAFMDSTGLNTLVDAHRASIEANSEFVIVTAEGTVSRLLTLAGVAEHITVLDQLPADLANGNR